MTQKIDSKTKGNCIICILYSTIVVHVKLQLNWLLKDIYDSIGQVQVSVLKRGGEKQAFEGWYTKKNIETGVCLGQTRLHSLNVESATACLHGYILYFWCKFHLRRIGYIVGTQTVRRVRQGVAPQVLELLTVALAKRVTLQQSCQATGH